MVEALGALAPLTLIAAGGKSGDRVSVTRCGRLSASRGREGGADLARGRQVSSMMSWRPLMIGPHKIL